MHRFVAAAIFLSGAYISPAAPAFAWGDDGHEIVALIADHYLQPAVRNKIYAMLSVDPDSLTKHDIASAATWADKFRDENHRRDHYQQTRNWHFVDIEIASPDLKKACFGEPPLPPETLASNGPATDCVFTKIDEFAAELEAPSTDAEERLVALKFLLHFVGDIHQPLHSSDNRDQGGNAVKVSGTHSSNLHSFWDTDVVQELGTSPRSIAQTLMAEISDAQAKQWASGTPADWAHEAFQVAKDDVYGKLPPAGPSGSHPLNASYLSGASIIASQQLSRAGVRLAFVINQALDH